MILIVFLFICIPVFPKNYSILILLQRKVLHKQNQHTVTRFLELCSRVLITTEGFAQAKPTHPGCMGEQQGRMGEQQGRMGEQQEITCYSSKSAISLCRILSLRPTASILRSSTPDFISSNNNSDTSWMPSLMSSRILTSSRYRK